LTIESKIHSFSERLDNFLVRYLAYFNYQSYVNRLNLKGNESILEVGCGSGNLTRFLIRKLPLGKLVCIDSNFYLINKVRRRLKSFKNIKFILRDIADYKNNTKFDIIIFHYVLHDIIKKEKVIVVLKNYLNKEGKIYIREPTRKEHGLDFREIRGLMLKNGFYEKESKIYSCFPLRSEIYEGVF